MEEKETQLKEQTEVKEIQWDRKKVFEIMKRLNVRGGEITIQPDGSIHAKGEEIDFNNQHHAEEAERIQQQQENTLLSSDEAIKKVEENKNKHIERKQYNWWLVLPILFLAIGIIITLFTPKKWRSKFK